MAENSAASQHTVLRPLSEANHEPGAQTISTVVRIRECDHEAADEAGLALPGQGAADRRRDLCPNHISNADPLAVGQFLAFSGRWPRFLAKASVFRIPVIGRIIAACGQIPVERGSAQSKDALVAAAQALEQGRALVIYPEGTITYDPDLWPMRGKTGAARLALTTGCPVVPIGQWGAQELMPGRKPTLPQALPAQDFARCGGRAGSRLMIFVLQAGHGSDARRGDDENHGRHHRLGRRASRCGTALVSLRSAERPDERRPNMSDAEASRYPARVAVMGAGSWGTAFALVVSRCGQPGHALGPPPRARGQDQLRTLQHRLFSRPAAARIVECGQ